jgi:hypothetical protein
MIYTKKPKKLRILSKNVLAFTVILRLDRRISQPNIPDSAVKPQNDKIEEQ